MSRGTRHINNTGHSIEGFCSTGSKRYKQRLRGMATIVFDGHMQLPALQERDPNTTAPPQAGEHNGLLFQRFH